MANEKLKIIILTLFPEMFGEVFGASIIGRAQKNGLLQVDLVNFRDFALDKHKTVDDTPYGGGAGMVLKVDVLDRALQAITKGDRKNYYSILLTPQGQPFKQQTAEELSTLGKNLVFICGHYEGFDERIRPLVDAEISLGDFVLSGGESAAIPIVDAVVRLLPGVLGKDYSSEEETFSLKDESGVLLEYPHYTRPEEYNGQKVPEVLLSGNHAEIKKWRLTQSKARTELKRPDLRG